MKENFADIYLAGLICPGGKFNPCPCGENFGDNGLEEAVRHFNLGHFEDNYKGDLS